MPKNTHNANIFNLEFGHEKFTLTFPAPLLKEVTLLYEHPPLNVFLTPQPCFRDQIFQSPFEKGRG